MVYEIERRAIRITVIAAAKAGDVGSYPHDWLVRDEEGTWRKRTLSYLESTAKRAAELSLTPEQVDEGIATKLALEALQAIAAREKA